MILLPPPTMISSLLLPPPPATTIQVAYADLTGSGVETISHMKENGRITFMFCSFDAGRPLIVRLFGKGRVVERGVGGGKEFDEWIEKIHHDVKDLDDVEVSLE